MAAAHDVGRLVATALGGAKDKMAAGARSVAERAGPACAAQARLAAAVGDQLRAHAQRSVHAQATRLYTAAADLAAGPPRFVRAAGRALDGLSERVAFWGRGSAAQ